MFKKLSFIIFLLTSFFANAQYATKHYIAPAPWQYWSKSNQLVISTLSTTPVTIEIFKSDYTPVTTFENVTAPLTLTDQNPLSIIFNGNPNDLTRNLVDISYSDRGLIIVASAPVFINYRNIDSDSSGTSGYHPLKMGNASLSSFGDEGLGLEFRVGYYREDFNGLDTGTSPHASPPWIPIGQPVYSIMATEDNTTIVGVPSGNLVLNEGESRLFFAPLGTLITADKPVVMNTGNWRDNTYLGHADGTFDQLAPIHQLGNKYVVVRGNGVSGTNSRYPEQTLIIATEPNTEIEIVNFNPDGTQFSTNTITLVNAGDTHNFHHGNTTTQYSSSYILADKNISVISGIAQAGEVAVSTLLPVGGCAGSTDVQTLKFQGYNGQGNLIDLPYFGYVVVESATEPVFFNQQNIETVTGINRVPIGNTGFYVMRFTNDHFSNPDNIIINSSAHLTISIVQRDENYAMSAFFSAFGQAAFAPTLLNINSDCTVTIEAQDGEDILEYEWFLDDESLVFTTENIISITESGSYAVKIRKECGWSNVSLPLSVQVEGCNDLSIKKEVINQVERNASFQITVKNNDAIFTDSNVVVNDLLPSGYSFINYTASQGTYDPVTGIWSVGSLSPLQEANMEIEVSILSNGEYLNTATVSGENEDKDQTNNQDTAIVQVGDFSFYKQALSSDFFRVGDIIEYQLEIRNTGSSTLRNIRIMDENADEGSINPSVIPEINVNSSAFAIAKHTVTIDDFKASEVINQARAIANLPTGDLEKLSDDPTTPILNDPTIVKITRTADIDATKDDGITIYTPGQQTTYTIVVKNNGPSSAIDVLVEDPTPYNDVNIMSWSNSNGKQGIGALSDIIPLLNVGESVVYYVSLTIPQNHKGNFVNTIYYSSIHNDHDPVEACTRCTDINEQEFSMPKGISPNGDHLNDYLDLEAYNIALLKIYNRYGKLVYNKEGYKNEWMGQSDNGDSLPDGTYFYNVIRYNGESYRGYIYLTKEIK